MRVSTITETRVGDRVYSIEATQESAYDGPRHGFLVEVTADAGSYRADAQLDTILTRIPFAADQRMLAEAVLDALIQVARDEFQNPFTD